MSKESKPMTEVKAFKELISIMKKIKTLGQCITILDNGSWLVRREDGVESMVQIYDNELKNFFKLAMIAPLKLLEEIKMNEIGVKGIEVYDSSDGIYIFKDEKSVIKIDKYVKDGSPLDINLLKETYYNSFMDYYHDFNENEDWKVLDSNLLALLIGGESIRVDFGSRNTFIVISKQLFPAIKSKPHSLACKDLGTIPGSNDDLRMAGFIERYDKFEIRTIVGYLDLDKINEEDKE